MKMCKKFYFFIMLFLLCIREPVIIDNSSKPHKASPITSENFETSLQNSGVALIEFYSENCILCQNMSWIIDTIFVNFNSKAFIGVSCIEEDTLYKRFNIKSVPTYIFFKNRVEIKRYVFYENKDEIYDTLAYFLQQIIENKVIDTSTFTKDSTIDTIPVDTTPIDTTQITDTLPTQDTLLIVDYPFLDSLSFDSLVLNKNKIAMVFFLNSHGIPCIYMDSVVKTILPQFKNRVFIGKVEAWEQISLSLQYGIDLVPQFLFFKKGIELSELRIIGEVSGDSLSSILEKLIEETGNEYIVNLNKDNFDSVVKKENSVVMVEFFSPYCGACISMEKKMAELALKYSDIATICKVDVTIEDSLRIAFEVRAWPTFIFFKNGEEQERHIGSTTLEILSEKLDKILGSP